VKQWVCPETYAKIPVISIIVVFDKIRRDFRGVPMVPKSNRRYILSKVSCLYICKQVIFAYNTEDDYIVQSRIVTGSRTSSLGEE